MDIAEEEYELHQHDQIVAGASGKNAYQEILHYAAQYSQDGPVEIFKVTRTKIDTQTAPNQWWLQSPIIAYASSHEGCANQVISKAQFDSALPKNREKFDVPLMRFEQANDGMLFCDLRTDEEKYNFFLSGKGYQTGVISLAIQNDVAMAYKRCAEFKKAMATPRNFCADCGKKTPPGSIHTCTPPHD